MGKDKGGGGTNPIPHLFCCIFVVLVAAGVQFALLLFHLRKQVYGEGNNNCSTDGQLFFFENSEVFLISK